MNVNPLLGGVLLGAEYFKTVTSWAKHFLSWAKSKSYELEIITSTGLNLFQGTF